MKNPHLDESSALHDGTSILIVDDTVANLLAFSAVLKSQGYRIVLARSGAEALQSALKEDFHLILMDIRMPEMNGFETAKLLREREKTRRTPIVFMSAYEVPSPWLFSKTLGSEVDFIPAPVDAQALISKVSSRLNRTAAKEGGQISDPNLERAPLASPDLRFNSPLPSSGNDARGGTFTGPPTKGDGVIDFP